MDLKYEYKNAQLENRNLLRDLTKRVQELTALNAATRILQDDGKSTEDLLDELVAVVLSATQYPDLTGARIRLGEVGAATPNFENSTPIVRVDFVTVDSQPGSIEISWTASQGDDGEGPLCNEGLVQTLADMLRTAIDRRQAEKKLHSRELLYRALIENSSDAIALLDRNGTILCASPLTPQILGFSPEELVRYNANEMCHPEHKALFAKNISELAKNPGATITMEARVRHRDGSWRWIEETLTNLLEETSVRAIVNNYRDITERKQAEDRVRGTTEELRALSENILSAREQEGTRIAREIHDELGSALTSLKWDLEGIDKTLSTSSEQLQLAPLRKRIEEMRRLMDTTISAVRRIASELRPSVLDDLGLCEALEWHAQQFQERTGIICKCDSSLHDLNLTQEQATAVFRIFQEVLTNVLRHAQATQVRFVMQRDGGEFLFTVTDNGRGITSEEKSGQCSLGLLGMRERAYLIGGTFDILGIKGKGTVVTVRVPGLSQG